MQRALKSCSAVGSSDALAHSPDFNALGVTTAVGSDHPVSVINREDVSVEVCDNCKADEVFCRSYWMKGVRRSRRISYQVCLRGEKVGWLQLADPFGTKLAKPLQSFSVGEALELSRGYFEEKAPSNIESCSIARVLKRAPDDWFIRFRQIKLIAIVYQDLDYGQKACVYRALGFRPYAYCVRARHFSASKRSGTSGCKLVWARGLKTVNGLHYTVRIPSSCIEHSLPEVSSTSASEGGISR
jgi:hypothetical protein